jgi:hypothetical protein
MRAVRVRDALDGRAIVGEHAQEFTREDLFVALDRAHGGLDVGARALGRAGWAEFASIR